MPTRVSRLGNTSAAILTRAIELKSGGMPPEGARYILSVTIRDKDKKRARATCQTTTGHDHRGTERHAKCLYSGRQHSLDSESESYSRIEECRPETLTV